LAGERLRTKLPTIIALMALTMAMPACAEMSDYERGVANGMKIGFFMGELYGKGQYSYDSAQEFNGFLDQFHQFLANSFKNNQTLINEFMKSPLPVRSSNAIGGTPYPDANGRIFGYPADAYYTAVGAGPGGVPENPGNAMGGV
jgi:hypothetical protein